MISIELRDLSKRYGERQVFSGITRVIEPGCLVVTGPNGSGKSTLLRIIAGLVSPTYGSVAFRDGGEISINRRDIVGLVSPQLALYSELSAHENLRFLARVRGINVSDEEISSLLERLGLGGRGDDCVGGYSSGMLQRMKFASAMLHRPCVLLLDEPFSNLDESGIEIISSVIEEYRQRGVVILATNDREDFKFADSMLELGD